MLLTMLRDGRLHLSGIAKLAPHLTPDNREAVLKLAVHKTKRQIEELLAELVPRPDAPAVMRKLPDRQTMTRPAATTELGPDRPQSARPERTAERVAPTPPQLGQD